MLGTHKMRGKRASVGNMDGEEGETSALKAKKARTAPTNTSLLPPCKVCLEPAAGFHYGVNTCEACKVTFNIDSVLEQIC
jgi:hypothetical protein